MWAEAVATVHDPVASFTAPYRDQSDPIAGFVVLFICSRSLEDVLVALRRNDFFRDLLGAKFNPVTHEGSAIHPRASLSSWSYQSGKRRLVCGTHSTDDPVNRDRYDIFTDSINRRLICLRKNNILSFSPVTNDVYFLRWCDIFSAIR